MAETSADTRYTLTEEELGWVTELRNALNAEGVPIPKPDLLLAQFALVGKGKLERTVKRVKKYQKNIIEDMQYTTEAAVQGGCVGVHQRKFPGFVEGARDTNGRVTLAVAGKFNKPSEIKGEEDMRLLLKEQLLWCDAFNADLDHIRKGSAFIQLVSETGFANFSLELQRRSIALSQDSYPGRVGIMPIVDGGPIISGLLKLVKVFLHKKTSERLVVCSSKELVTKHGFDPAGLPPMLGGTFVQPYEEWIHEKLAQRAISAQRVRIP